MTIAKEACQHVEEAVAAEEFVVMTARSDGRDGFHVHIDCHFPTRHLPELLGMIRRDFEQRIAEAPLWEEAVDNSLRPGDNTKKAL